MPHVTMGSACLRQAWDAREEGRPLPPDLRTVLERRLGADLAAVRVHTGPAADAAAAAFGADAVANGSGVFFRTGAYRPHSPEGLRLLAHEVAHTVQQATGARDHADGRWEAAADRFADGVLASGGAAGWARDKAVVVPTGPSRTVQRHSSFEHRYLGDGSTQNLVDVSLRTPGKWDVNLRQQILFNSLWQRDPQDVTEADIAYVDPTMRTLRLGPDNVLMTHGEVNALPDYLANPEAIEQTPASILVPILQVIRQEGYNQLTALLTGKNPTVTFAQAACAPWSLSLVNNIMETQGIDQLTAGLGPNHYQGLLARNACHFAPYAWYRWLSSHLIARETALLAFQASGERKAQLTREAWTYHGYADHFLQDSFAAGHLINKTLVMQWFIDWAAINGYLPVADWDSIEYLTPSLQPGLSARQMYSPAYQGPSLDPQTVQEAATFVQRATAAGLRPGRANGQIDSYESYLTVLTSAAAQLGTANLHDYYNDNSLWVASAQNPAGYRIWGDSTLLNNPNGADGVRATSETAQLSQQALIDILNTGGTAISIADIRSRIPTMAGSDASSLAPLETWIDSQREWVEEKIFTGFVSSLKQLLLELGSPTLGTVSQDQALAASWNTQIGGSSNYSQTTTLIVNGRVFASSNAMVTECDPVSGAAKQSIRLPGSGNATAVLCADTNNLYIGTYGRVFALPLNSAWGSSPLWTSASAGGSSGDGPVDLLVANGTLFTGCNGYVGQLRVSDGVFLHNVLITSSIGVGDYRTRLASDGNLLYAGVHAYAYGLRLTDISARPVWTSPALSGTFSYAEVTPMFAGGRLFATSNGYAYELNTANGTIARWIRVASVVGTGDYTGSLATDGARLYVGTHGYVYALSASDAWTNSPLWTSPRLGGLLGFGPVSLAFTGDQLLAGSNGFSYEINLFDGTLTQTAQMTSALGLGDYTTQITTDGQILCAGTHGYAYRMQLISRGSAPHAYWRLNQTSGSAVPDERAEFPAIASAVNWLAMPGAGGAAVFNGTNSTIDTFGPVLDTGPAGSFTVTAWAIISYPLPPLAGVVSQDGKVSSAFSLLYSGSDQTWVFQRATSDSVNPAMVKIAVPAVYGTWTYLAAVYDATAGQMSLYVNGNLAGTAPFSPSQAFASSGPFGIGRSQAFGLPANFMFGQVREVKAYQRVLDPLELAAADDHFWRLDETSGTVAADIAGNLPATAAQVTWTTLPGTGGCAVFNGTSSFVAAPGPALYTGPGSCYTVTAWVRLDASNGQTNFAVSQAGSRSTAFAVGYATPQQAWYFTRATADDPSRHTDIFVTVGQAPIGVWTHLAGVYDVATQTMSLYVNGSLAGSASTPWVTPFASTGALLIGRGAGGNWFPGAIRDVRVFGQALTAAQIAAIVVDPSSPVPVKEKGKGHHDQNHGHGHGHDHDHDHDADHGNGHGHDHGHDHIGREAERVPSR